MYIIVVINENIKKREREREIAANINQDDEIYKFDKL